MPTPDHYLNVEMPFRRIEEVVSDTASLRLPERILPNGFARIAWAELGGKSPDVCRASALFGSAIQLADDERGLVLVAYVILPNITFAGWVVAETVPHPRRVDPIHLRSVWELLPHAWMGLLSQPSRQGRSTWLEWLSRPSACIMDAGVPPSEDAHRDRPDRTPPVGHPPLGRHAHADPRPAAV